MYDVSGILYRASALGMRGIAFGIIALIISRFWNKEKREIKMLIVSALLLLWGFVDIGYYSYKAANPVVAVYEGYFCEEYRDSYAHGVHSWEYVFDDKSGKPKPQFFLDSGSKKEIYPEEFVEGVRYRIFYEEDTNIILEVQKIGDS